MRGIGYTILISAFLFYAITADNFSKNEHAVEQTKDRIAQSAKRV